MRSLLLLALACLLLTAAAPAHAAWPALAGTTTIEGSSTGYATLRLAKPVTVDLWSEEGSIGVELSGSGRLYGVVLREEAPAGREPVTGYATHSERFPYEPFGELQFGWDHYEESGTVTLPAGVYRLYVIADGKPVRAVVRMPGVSGSTSVTPQVPVPQTLTDLPRLDGGVPNVTIRGGSATLPSRGLVVRQQRLDVRDSAYESFEPCEYPPGSEPAAEPVAFGPRCGGTGEDRTWLEHWLEWELAAASADPAQYAQDSAATAAWYAEASAEDLAAGQPPYPPHFLPIYDLYSVHPPETWAEGYNAVLSENAEPGAWHLGGNMTGAGAAAAMEMLGAWIAYDAVPGTPVPTEPADPAPKPAAPGGGGGTGSPAPPARAGEAASSTRPAPAAKKAARKKACRARGKTRKAKRRRAACVKRRAAARRKAAARKRNR